MYTATASTAKIAATATRLWPLLVSARNRNTNTAASDPRAIDDFQVGGVFRRLSRAVIFACFLRSSAVGGRPVRPRASIVPAGVPRCLLRRLRLVWAMGKGA